MFPTCCILCGVPFIPVESWFAEQAKAASAWTESICALTVADSCHDALACHDEGKGAHWQLTDRGDRGKGYPIDGIFRKDLCRLSDEEADQLILDYPNMFKRLRGSKYLTAYTTRGSKLRVAYPMHPACLEILQQCYAQLSTGISFNFDILGEIFSCKPLKSQKGMAIIPDWNNGYGDDDCWDGKDNGWGLEDELEDLLGLSSEYSSHLLKDPRLTHGLDYLLQDPPLKPGTRGVAYTSTTARSLPAVTQDLFSQLPQELLSMIFCLLPARDVLSVRLASKIMATASLDIHYWRSRFDYPHELCHIPWDPTWGTAKAGGRTIDWDSFCACLLHGGNGRDFESLKNRKRIRSLNTKLARKMLAMQARLDTSRSGEGHFIPPKASLPVFSG